MVFDRVHLLTLCLAPASSAVAEDYGIHYFAARQGREAVRALHGSAKLAARPAYGLATSVVAYLALGLAPFPALRQMAVFSAVGLAAAFLTVVCWFPLLDRKALPDTAFARVRRGKPSSLARGTPAAAIGCRRGPRCPHHPRPREARQPRRVAPTAKRPPSLIEQQRQVSALLGLRARSVLPDRGSRRSGPPATGGGAHPAPGSSVGQGVLTGYARFRLAALPCASERECAPHRQGGGGGAGDRRPGNRRTSREDRAERKATRARRVACGPRRACHAIAMAWPHPRDEYSVVMLMGVTRESLPSLQRAARVFQGSNGWTGPRTCQRSCIDTASSLAACSSPVTRRCGQPCIALRPRILAALLPTALGSLLTLALFGMVGRAVSTVHSAGLAPAARDGGSTTESS